MKTLVTVVVAFSYSDIPKKYQSGLSMFRFNLVLGI